MNQDMCVSITNNSNIFRAYKNEYQQSNLKYDKINIKGGEMNGCLKCCVMRLLLFQFCNLVFIICMLCSVCIQRSIQIYGFAS